MSSQGLSRQKHLFHGKIIAIIWNKHMKKTGRNDPCPCGSGKKFKKCCESKMIGKRFLAQKLDQASTLAPRVNKLTSFFQNTVVQNPGASSKTFTASMSPPKENKEAPPESTETSTETKQ